MRLRALPHPRPGPAQDDPGYPAVDLGAILALLCALALGATAVAVLLAAALTVRWFRWAPWLG